MPGKDELSGLSERTTLLANLAREAPAPLSEQKLEHGFAQLRGQRDRRSARLTVGRIAFACAATGAVAFALYFGRASWLRAHPAVLSYQIVDAEIEQQGYLRSAPGAHPVVTFSDGTVLKLAEHARLRLNHVHAHGARLTLEDGQVRAEVVHKPDAEWGFEAGPFFVEVKGTVFSLAWSGQAGRLEVALETGRLNIRTPFAEQPVALGSGQRLIVTLADKHVDIVPLGANPEPQHTPLLPARPAEEPVEEGERAQAANSKRTVVRPSARVSWAENLSNGNLKAIVDEARRRGLDATLAERSSEELDLLADAARYTGDKGIARSALMAQRRRFPGSMRATKAAFLLGRIEEDADPKGAVAFYDMYLAEAPDGSFTAEALGRKMMAAQRAFGTERARPVAETYLKKYPADAYAAAARSIARGP
jgi:hypothetical protein